MPRVSFLVPLFDAEREAPGALRSILEQSVPDLEVIAVDDGSTDGTREMLRATAASDPRVKPVFVEHGGIVSALNAGLPHCSGSVVVRLDADDRAAPERVALQLAMLEDQPSLAAVGSRVALRTPPTDTEGNGMAHYLRWSNGLLAPADIAAARFVEAPVVHTSMAIRTDTLRALGGYRATPSPEDYDLILRMLQRGMPIAKVDEVLTRIGDDPTRLTRTDPRCSRASFHQCRLHHLLQGPLDGQDQALLWGAGKTGKRWMRDLAQAGCPVGLLADGNPRRHGKSIGGARVVSPDALAECYHARLRSDAGSPPILIAIAARGVRREITDWAKRHELREGVDFFSLAGMTD